MRLCMVQISILSVIVSLEVLSIDVGLVRLRGEAVDGVRLILRYCEQSRATLLG